MPFNKTQNKNSRGKAEQPVTIKHKSTVNLLYKICLMECKWVIFKHNSEPSLSYIHMYVHVQLCIWGVHIRRIRMRCVMNILIVYNSHLFQFSFLNLQRISLKCAWSLVDGSAAVCTVCAGCYCDMTAWCGIMFCVCCLVLSWPPWPFSPPGPRPH